MDARFTRDGIVLPALGLGIDGAGERTVLLRATGEAPRDRPVLGAPETLRRLGRIDDPRATALPPGAPVALGEATITALPSGSTPDASWLLVEAGGERLLVALAARLREPLVGAPATPVGCDRLILDATFGLPVFRFLDGPAARARLLAFVRATLAERELPVVLAEADGVGPEVALALAGTGVGVRVAPAVAAWLPPLARLPISDGPAPGAAWIVEPADAPKAGGRPRRRLALVGPLAAHDHARFAFGVEELVPGAATADFEELVALVERSGAAQVDLVGRHAAAFARILRRRGHDALPLEARPTATGPGRGRAGGAIAVAHGSPPDATAAPAAPAPPAPRSTALAARPAEAPPPPPAARDAPGSFDRFAAVCEAIAARTSRLHKRGTLAAFLASLDDADLARAVVFASGLPFPRPDPRRLQVGGAALVEAAMAASGFDAETIAASWHEVGDGGEAVALLLAGRTEERPLALAEAEAAFESLERARKPAARAEALAAILRRHRPSALKYVLKVIGGELRIGLQEKLVEEAIAEATGADLEEVRAASVRSGHLGRVAVAARHGALAAVEATLFHPLDFMLAKPVDELAEVEEPGLFLVEDKLDGIRAQAHVEGGRVALFSRGLEELTAAFPELAAALRALPGSCAIDGEILAWKDGRALPFGLFQQRLARKRVTAAICEAIPVALVAFDLLYRDGRLLLDEPLEARRASLADLLAGADPRLRFSAAREARSELDLEREFAAARARGNEGLVLKRKGSRYEAGRRGGAWRKVKRPFATLDVVVTAVERGHGKRASLLSDVTFAVRGGDRLVNVGKAYSGLTDAEIRELTRIFEGLATRRHGPVTTVRPEVVLEVAFDAVTASERHGSGFALRFPRIVRWRRDKTAEQIDDVGRVAALHRLSLGPAPEPAEAPALEADERP